MERVNVFVKFSGAIDNLLALGLRAGPPVRSPHDDQLVVAGSIPTERLSDLEREPNVHRVERSQLLRPMLNTLVPSIHADVLRERNPSIDGTGVVVGIIDSGIDFTHHNFRTGDKFQDSRILSAWDQGVEPSNHLGPTIAPDLGREYSNEQIKAALATETAANPNAPFDVIPLVDGDQEFHSKGPHGTGVAGVAAGNGNEVGRCSPGSHYFGVAPKADLIFVKYKLEQVDSSERTGLFDDANKFHDIYLGDSVNIMNGGQYIFDKAASLSKPCVVNISLGTTLGPHDGSTLLEQMLDGLLVQNVSGQAQGVPGRAIAMIAPGETQDIVFRVPPHVGGFPTPEEVQVVHDGGDDLEITVSPPHITPPKTVGPLPSGVDKKDFVINPGDPEEDQLAVRFEREAKMMRLFLKFASAKSFHAFPSGGWHIHLNNKSATNTVTADVFMDGQEFFGKFREAMRRKEAPDFQLSFRFPFDTDKTANGATPMSVNRTVSTPAWAKYVVAVGAFDHHSLGKAGGPTISEYSGRGTPNMPLETLKPDLVAGGEGIKSPFAFANDRVAHLVSYKFCSRCCYAFYALWDGTSFSAPLVAGVVALMLQVNPTLDAIKIKQVLRESADKPTVDPPIPNHIWGYGIVNALAAVDHPLVHSAGSTSAGASATTGSGGSAKSAARTPAFPAGSILPSFLDFIRSLRLPESSVATLLVSKHFSEVRRLIDKDRRIALLWHRCRGPRLVQGTLRYLYDGGGSRRRLVVGGAAETRRLLKFFGALSERGSVRLRTDLGRFGGELLGVLEGRSDSRGSPSPIAAG
jgi:subtilisin family serine protease